MIDLNELMNSGADAEALMEAVKKNLAEKAAAEEAKAQAEAEKKAKEAEKQRFCDEGRQYLINAILAYDDAFHFLGDEPVTKEEIAEIEKMIKRWEKSLPTAFRIAIDRKMDPEKLWRTFGLGFWL